MQFRSTHDQHASPARLLEMLSDRFAALEAVAYSSIKLARHMAEPELSMDLLVASAVLEFADDLRAAGEAADAGPLRGVQDDGELQPSGSRE